MRFAGCDSIQATSLFGGWSFFGSRAFDDCHPSAITNQALQTRFNRQQVIRIRNQAYPFCMSKAKDIVLGLTIYLIWISIHLVILVLLSGNGPLAITNYYYLALLCITIFTLAVVWFLQTRVALPPPETGMTILQAGLIAVTFVVASSVSDSGFATGCGGGGNEGCGYLWLVINGTTILICAFLIAVGILCRVLAKSFTLGQFNRLHLLLIPSLISIFAIQMYGTYFALECAVLITPERRDRCYYSSSTFHFFGSDQRTFLCDEIVDEFLKSDCKMQLPYPDAHVWGSEH